MSGLAATVSQAGGGRPQGRQDPGGGEPPAPTGDEHDADECGRHGQDEQQLAGWRQLEGMRQLVARQGEEDHHEDQVSHGSHERIDTDGGNTGTGWDAPLLQEPGVQGHAADIGGGDSVDER